MILHWAKVLWNVPQNYSCMDNKLKMLRINAMKSFINVFISVFSRLIYLLNILLSNNYWCVGEIIVWRIDIEECYSIMFTWPYLITFDSSKFIMTQGNPFCFQADFTDREFALCLFPCYQPEPWKQPAKGSESQSH